MESTSGLSLTSSYGISVFRWTFGWVNEFALHQTEKYSILMSVYPGSNCTSPSMKVVLENTMAMSLGQSVKLIFPSGSRTKSSNVFRADCNYYFLRRGKRINARKCIKYCFFTQILETASDTQHSAILEHHYKQNKLRFMLLLCLLWCQQSYPSHQETLFSLKRDKERKRSFEGFGDIL